MKYKSLGRVNILIFKNNKNSVFNIQIVFFILFTFLLSVNYCFSGDYYQAGKESFEKQNYSNAKYYFEKSLKRFPDNLRIRYLYALTLVNLKNFDDAKREFQKIIIAAPQSGEAKLATEGITLIWTRELGRRGKLSYKSGDSLLRSKFEIKSAGDNYISNALENGKVRRWHSEKMPIKLYIERAEGVPGYKDFYRTAVKKAMDEWVNKIEGSLLSYKIVNNPKEAHIRITFVPEILKGTKQDFIAGLATPHARNQILNYYDVKLATQVPPDDRPFTQQELYATALHELGHALGIRGHSNNKNDIMYSTTNVNPKNTNVKLSERDINTITLLYTLDPHISNFDPGDEIAATSEKNQKFLGSQEDRLNEQLKEAINYTEKFPNNVLSWTQLGKAYYNLKQYKNAAASYEKAVEIDSTYLNAVESLAFVYKQLGNFNKASEQFKKLIKTEPDDIKYSYNYSLYLVNNKKYDQAQSVLNALLIKNPEAKNDADIKKLLNYINNK